LLNRELVSRAKLCLVSVYPDIVKDCPKIRNLPKIFLRSFKKWPQFDCEHVISTCWGAGAGHVVTLWFCVSVAGSMPTSSITCDLMKRSVSHIASSLLVKCYVHQSVERLTLTAYWALAVSWTCMPTAWSVCTLTCWHYCVTRSLSRY